MLALLAALLIASPATPSPEPDRLANARSLLAAQKYADALVDLQAVSQMYGNTPRETAELYALRASALLGLPDSPEHRQDASDALAQMFHVDPEGTALARATDAARAAAQQVRKTRALVLTDRLVTARTGRPLRIRARLTGAVAGEPQLFLNYALPHADEDAEFIKVQMERASVPGTWEAWLRPGVGGVPSGGEHLMLYFISAEVQQAALDSNGTAKDPIRLTLSDTLPEAAGIAALDEGGRPAHPVLPPPSTPWYRRWEIVVPIVAAVVVGGVIVGLEAQPKPQPANGSLGRIDLP